MKRRILSLLLASVMLACSLTGCGKKGPEDALNFYIETIVAQGAVEEWGDASDEETREVVTKYLDEISKRKTYMGYPAYAISSSKFESDDHYLRRGTLLNSVATCRVNHLGIEEVGNNTHVVDIIPDGEGGYRYIVRSGHTYIYEADEEFAIKVFNAGNYSDYRGMPKVSSVEEIIALQNPEINGTDASILELFAEVTKTGEKEGVFSDLETDEEMYNFALAFLKEKTQANTTHGFAGYSAYLSPDKLDPLCSENMDFTGISSATLEGMMPNAVAEWTRPQPCEYDEMITKVFLVKAASDGYRVVCVCATNLAEELHMFEADEAYAVTTYNEVYAGCRNFEPVNSIEDILEREGK